MSNLININEVKEQCIRANRDYYENGQVYGEQDWEKYLEKIPFSELSGCGKEGIPVASKIIHGERTLFLAKPSHTLVLGSTGMGKSQCQILPMIEKLALDGCGNSFVAVDVKGELSQKTSLLLQKNGYTVKVVNFCEPLYSVYYNPLTATYEKFMLARAKEKEINEALAQAKTEKQKAKLLAEKNQVNISDSECAAEINQYAEIMVPLEGQKDVSWDYGAREIVKGILHGMLEVAAKSPEKMPVEKFTIANLCNIAFARGNDYDDMRSWYRKFPKTSMARSLISQYYELNAKQTRDSFIVSATGKLQRYYSIPLQMMSSRDDIRIKDLISTLKDKKTAIFIVVDDSRTETYNLCLMLLNQLLVSLREYAKQRQTKHLEKDFYFLMDEFCNMPTFPDIEHWITSLRSYGIWLVMAIQSYEQLSKRYGEENANIIKGNCDLRVFMGSRDRATLEEVSKEAGYTCAAVANYAMGNNGALSMSITPSNVPLVRVSDLRTLTLGHHLVFCGGNIFWLDVIPYFACHDSEEEYDVKKRKLNPYFDKDANFYSLVEDDYEDDSVGNDLDDFFRRRRPGK